MEAVLETPSIEEEAAKRKAEARKHFDAIKKSNLLVSTNSLRIGYHASFLKKNNLFGILGYESEGDAREAAGVGSSTWYANIAIAELFDGVEEENFCAMRQANAKALGDLPLSKRMDPKWLKRAAETPIKTFAIEVEDELNGDAKRSDGKEHISSIKMTAPESRKKVIEDGIIEIAKKTGVDPEDKSKVIENLIVQETGRMSLMESIANAIQRVKAAKEITHSDLSAAEILEKVMAELDAMVIDFQSALDGSAQTILEAE
jgi:hypothetical protein